MTKKKISEKTWYFYFGFGAIFVIIGFLWIFSYYAQTPGYIKQSINKTPPTQTTQLIIEKPPFPYTAVYMVIFGTIVFLTTKYFYNKGEYHVKRTRKHG